MSALCALVGFVVTLGPLATAVAAGLTVGAIMVLFNGYSAHYRWRHMRCERDTGVRMVAEPA